MRRSWGSIHDFVSAHYLFADGDGPFWEAVGSMEPSRRVRRLAEAFDRNGFSTVVDVTQNDADVEDFLIFRPVDFSLIMRNLGVESSFYEAHDFEVRESVREEREAFYREVSEDVADYLTTEEVYRGIPELSEIG